jgi:putative aminopeptidase FrvX
MSQDASRAKYERWLLEVTSLPTAAGHEERVIAWIERWVAQRRGLVLDRDRAGNLFITRRRGAGTRRRKSGATAPLYITAHMDHPAFVVTAVRGRDVDLEFRGGVHAPYFENAALTLHGRRGVQRAVIVESNHGAEPFGTFVARMDAESPDVVPGDIGRFELAEDFPRIEDGRLFTYGCDDLTGVVAALAALDRLSRKPGLDHVGLLFTRAEEVGFIGALAACRAKSIPKSARLICLENSRSFADSPIGGGPIVRVGDRTSVFEPSLTNAISLLMVEHEKASPGFVWQRKLMPGGTCEATAFSSFGYRSTCLCLPLGNYHNMVGIDEVQAGQRPARVGAEYVALSDFHGLVEMLVVTATQIDKSDAPSLRTRMADLLARKGHVLRGSA